VCLASQSEAQYGGTRARHCLLQPIQRLQPRMLSWLQVHCVAVVHPSPAGKPSSSVIIEHVQPLASAAVLQASLQNHRCCSRMLTSCILTATDTLSRLNPCFCCCPAGKLTETQVLLSHADKLHLDRYGFIVSEAEAHARAARSRRTPAQAKREQRHVAKWRRMLGSSRCVAWMGLWLVLPAAA
jgi:hypothetical protein